jgi:hypothetical protein
MTYEEWQKNRVNYALVSYIYPQLERFVTWKQSSNEADNYTYPLSPSNLRHLVHLVSNLTRCSVVQIQSWVNELLTDTNIQNHVRDVTLASPYRLASDLEYRPGRRVGWYLFCRALKPKVVIETGIHNGLGSVTLCSALWRNSLEGFQGYYYGTDINPNAG